MVWNVIHLPRANCLFVWIVQCLQGIHLRRMCVDALVIKISDGFEFIITVVLYDGETPFLFIGIYLVQTRNYLVSSSAVACFYWP